MTTAKEVMHAGAQCIGQRQTLAEAARMMRDLDVGALPICGEDDRLHGIITDRDIVIKCLAEGRDPNTMTAEQLAQGTPAYVDAAADTNEVIQLMKRRQIKRVPVIEEHRLVGMISEADLARSLPEDQVGAFVEILTS